MAKRMEIFSTRDDILSLLSEIEEERSILYAKTGVYLTPTCPTYLSARAIPNLGLTSQPNRTSSDRYMVLPGDVKLLFREVTQNTGDSVFILDPTRNSPCVLITCGGKYDNGRETVGCLIGGLIETAYKDSQVNGLYGALLRRVKGCYTKINRQDLDSYIGPNAMVLLREGWRLTENCHAPCSLDLKLPSDL